jgi:hypothetical protein
MSDQILSLGDKCYSLITTDNNFRLFFISERYLVPFTPSKTLRAHCRSTTVYPKYGDIILLQKYRLFLLSARLFANSSSMRISGGK